MPGARKGAHGGARPLADATDLFAAAGVPLPIAAVDPEDMFLATSADRTVWDNLPPHVSEDFIFTHVARLDAAGPVDVLCGTTLERWGHVKRVIALAWREWPKRQRPAILSMRLPPLDTARRQKIAKIAAALREGGTP